MADYRIQLGVDLRVGDIRKRISEYNSNSNNAKLRLGIKLDTRGISEQIRAINSKTPVKLQVKMDTKNVQKQINSIRRQIQQLGGIRINLGGSGTSGVRNGINSTVNEVNKAYTDLMNLASRINSIRLQIGGLDASKNSGQITELSGQLNRLMTDYNNLYNTFTKGLDLKGLATVKNEINSVTTELDKLRLKKQSMEQQGINTAKDKLEMQKTKVEIKSLEQQLNSLKATYQSMSNGLTVGQIDSLANTFQITTDKVSALNAKLADTKANLASGIQLKVKTGDIAGQISALETKFGNLKTKTAELSTGMQAVRTASSNLTAAIQSGDPNKIISSYKMYEEVLKTVTNQVNMAAQAEKQAADARARAAAQTKSLQDRTNLSLSMDAWLKRNSKAASQFGGRIRQLQSELQTCDNQRLTGIRSEFQKIKLEAELAGKNMLTFADGVKKQFRRFSTYFSVSMMIMQSIRALRSMFNQVKAIDSAMTELKKVTDETDASYERFLTNAASKAKEIGTTIDGLVSSTADFARLGYSFEDAQGLAEVANIYAVVGDEIEGVEQATESLISTMAAFKDSAGGLSNTDFAMTIIDKFNEIGNNFAISSGGIGEALERSASSLDAANNTIDESIALITAANTVVVLCHAA